VKDWILDVVLVGVVAIVGIFAYWYVNADNYRMAGVPVLNYHQVNDTYKTPLTMTTADFEEQMKYLYDNGYHAITQEQLLQYINGSGILPDKPVLVTFDDGYIDNYENAYPIMKKYNMTGTIFLIINLMGKSGYLTWSQVHAMAKDGFEFGSHTVSHKPLTQLDEDYLRQELVQSKMRIEQQLGKPVTCIAYPEGKYNDLVELETKRAHYQAAFTVNVGKDFPGDDHYALDRIPIFEGFGSFWHFKFRLIFSDLTSYLWGVRVYLENTKWFKPLAQYVPLP
jgi:peptidoglycan/xylan/chitin deacetylase (PgdA/CDA1 family)